MHDKIEAGSAEIWRAANSRRTQDLSRWAHTASRRPTQPELRSTLPRQFLKRGLAATIAAFATLLSVSAAIHEGKTSRFAPRATATMPAVNVP
jgi:hypothetical protein